MMFPEIWSTSRLVVSAGEIKFLSPSFFPSPSLPSGPNFPFKAFPSLGDFWAGFRSLIDNPLMMSAEILDYWNLDYCSHFSSCLQIRATFHIASFLCLLLGHQSVERRMWVFTYAYRIPIGRKRVRFSSMSNWGRKGVGNVKPNHYKFETNYHTTWW